MSGIVVEYIDKVTCWVQKYYLSHIEGNELEVCNFRAQVFLSLLCYQFRNPLWNWFTLISLSKQFYAPCLASSTYACSLFLTHTQRIL